jgi:lipopolysaccharide export system permease protein
MILLRKFVLSSVLPVFFLALVFFVLLLQLVDLFSQLNRYLAFEIPFSLVSWIQLLYLPRSIQFALPMALLFGISYSMGMFHSHSELLSVYSSGVSLFRFSIPICLLGVLLGVGSFFFEEHLVIPTMKQRSEISNAAMGIGMRGTSREVTRFDDQGQIIYSADFYSAISQELSRPRVILRSLDGHLLRTMFAETAYWDDLRGQWIFRGVWDYQYHEDSVVQVSFVSEYSTPLFNKPPEDFVLTEQTLEEMQLNEARRWIRSLEASGISVRRERTSYYERYSFALTPFVVTLLSIPLGGAFKKNLLLMSLLISLGFSVLFFIARMVGGLMANLGLIEPIIGAWIGTGLFALLGLLLFLFSKT